MRLESLLRHTNPTVRTPLSVLTNPTPTTITKFSEHLKISRLRSHHQPSTPWYPPPHSQKPSHHQKTPSLPFCPYKKPSIPWSLHRVTLPPSPNLKSAPQVLLNLPKHPHPTTNPLFLTKRKEKAKLRQHKLTPSPSPSYCAAPFPPLHYILHIILMSHCITTSPLISTLTSPSLNPHSKPSPNPSPPTPAVSFPPKPTSPVPNRDGGSDSHPSPRR